MTKYEDIPLELIEIGPNQSRSRKVQEGIDELATNIEKNGLINPITVFKTNGKYELLAGQRRFLAVTKLGWTTIPAYIIEKPKDPIRAKAISFSENFMRKPMVDPDLIDACVDFYHKYGTMTAAAKELGLPYPEVRKFIKYDRLPDELKVKVDKGTIPMPVALKATDAATLPDNTVDEEKAMALATEMVKMDTITQDKLKKEAQTNPSASVVVLTEAVKKPETKISLKIVMLLPPYESLKKFTEASKLSSAEEAAVNLIIDGLTSKGFYSEVETS